MILLDGSDDVLRVVTSAAVTVDVAAGFASHASGTITPGRQFTAITTATTTTVVAAPGASIQRTIRFLSIRNKHATTACTVTLELFNGTSAFEIYEVTLAAGEQLLYDEANGWQYLSALGMPKMAESLGSSAPASSTINLVVLASDVINNNSVANSIADVTGLSFPVVAGGTYWFEFYIDYTAAATTTGSRWSISGPTFSRLSYQSNYSLSATGFTFNSAVAYDFPAASSASSAATTGNTAYIAGFITPSANGSVIARFASEISSSAITAKAGSVCRWVKVI